MQLPLRLPRSDPSDQIRPAADRDEPVFWVRRLRVLRELTPGDDHVVRDVVLRRGLNIVWAPPVTPEQTGELFLDGIAGHTAGKTTFCRLLRYCLGEATFAPDSTRKRIRGALPAGWVLAEILCEGTPWCVARPLGVGRSSFCLRDADANQVFDAEARLDFQVFVNALDAACGSSLPARSFPARRELIRFEHLLPWLTRDQECRFADFLEWRHPASDSQSPALTSDERQFVVRSLLSLITDDERQEQQRNARLVSDKAAATARAPLLAHQAGVDHARVERILGIDLAAPSDELFGNQARRELGGRREQLAPRLQALEADDDRAAAQRGLESAVAAEASAAHALAEAKERLRIERATLEQLDPEATGSDQDGPFVQLPPPTGYCNVPMDLARERGCPLAATRPIDLAERRAERTLQEQLEAHRAVVRALEARAEACRITHAAAAQATVSARAVLTRTSTVFRGRMSTLLREQATLEQVDRLIDNAEEAARASARLVEAVATLDDQIRDSYGRQDELRRATAEALRRVSARFDYVVRALVGDDLAARVEASGRSLKLVADENGERESAAIESIKLLGFDLAALTESVEGRGHHPRFVVHDGPRAADMSEDIYGRLFVYSRRLEECFDGEPSFQYIVTTTTPPPVEVQGERWVRLELRGAPGSQRLLGADL